MMNFDDEDDSGSNLQLFKKIYQRQRKKQEKITQIRLNKLTAKQELNKMKDQRSVEDEDLNERYRTREKHLPKESQSIGETPLELKWHIYTKCPNLNLASVVDKDLLELPIYKKKDEIMNSIIKDQFVLITGDTGCGKSTQVPRIIYEYLKATNDSKSKIMCIQPRRLAVINLYSILSKQLSQSLIGYRIGMKKKTDPSNRIVFVTNGIFLQKIVHSTEFFQEFPFIILDEVHQRDIDTDFILLTIKRIIRKFPKVRIILMSATIDNELFRYYFASDHIDSILQQDNYYGKVLAHENLKKQQREKKRQEDIQIQMQSDRQENLYKDFELPFMQAKFPCPAINVTEPGKFKRQYYYLNTVQKFLPNNVLSSKWGQVIFSQKYPETHKELFETVCLIIQQIYYLQKKQENKCSILIFMPGLHEIETVSEYIASYLKSERMKDFDVVPVHSSILNDETTQKLHQVKNTKIRLIIATNIAESSITVLGVKYVIDFCLTKQIRFDLRSRMQNLELVWTSKASCKQRAGRTGRVCDGVIFRLLEEQFYKKLPEYSTPEIQRSSLDKLILRIKLMHEGQQNNEEQEESRNENNNIFADPGAVLGSAIQPPYLKNIDTAIKSLQFCGGIQIKQDQFKMTKLGRLYIDIPIDITYCKLLVMSKLFGNYNDILILVSILSQSKAAIRKTTIQKNYKLFYDTIQNPSSCDFQSLINLYKKTEKYVQNYIKNSGGGSSRNGDNSYKIKQAIRRRPLDELFLETFAQVVELKNDIDKRINNLMSSFLKDQFSQREEEKELRAQYMKFVEYAIPGSNREEKMKANQQLKFKLTLISGFIQNMLKIREPILDEKQEKRLNHMKKMCITHKNTICILGSNILKKPDNQESQGKMINVWKNHIKQAMKISNTNFTLTYGLSYLHFDHEIDLQKFLFYKHMEESKNVKNNNFHNQDSNMQESTRYLKIPQILKCFGEIDHMNAGRPVTFCKEQTMFIDNFSMNRLINMNQNQKPKYLIANSIAKQSSRMITRYTSLLPANIKYIEVLSYLLFYPFVSLIKNTKKTKYEYIYISKKIKINIPYELSNQEITKANTIRQLIKEFLLLKKTGDSLQLKQIKLAYFMIEFLLLQRRQNFEEDHWQQLFLQENVLNNQELKNEYEDVIYHNNAVIQDEPESEYFGNRQFMNEIKTSSLKYSYFSNISIAQTDLLERKSVYYAWKVRKLREVEEIERKVQDNDSYLACGDNTCGLRLAKLKMVGPVNQQIFRQLYQIQLKNIVEMPFNEINNHFCSMLMSNNIDAEYKLKGCANGHYFGILIDKEKRIKILPFSNLMMIYPDGSAQQCNFEDLEMKYWKKKHDSKLQHKYKMNINTVCFICNQSFSSMRQLQAHIKQTKDHQYNVQQFRRNIQETANDKGPDKEIKCQ